MTQFLDVARALALHDASLTRYGGLPGIRDAGALASAVAQPEASFGGQLLHSTVYDQASAYHFHIAKNHAFLDGNKRTALACAVVFLEMNGYEIPREANDELEALTLRVAEGQVSKAQLSAYFCAMFEPA
jgi:death-on-curing protein